MQDRALATMDEAAVTSTALGPQGSNPGGNATCDNAQCHDPSNSTGVYDATWTIDGSIFYPRPGSMNASEGIRIEGPGFTLEGGPTHLYMSSEAVALSFMPDPETGSAPGTP